MKRWDIINKYITKNEYKDYLEIGVESGLCRDYIVVQNKTTVDPDKRANNPTHRMTSDEFFKQNKQQFDVIFIDGLHHVEQVFRDISNSLSVLKDGGMIFCHDMLPTQEKVQAVPRINATWTGDCWKAWAKLRGTATDLEMFIVNDDWGVGVIKKGKQEIVPELNIEIGKMDWNFFCKNKHKFNIKSVAEFAKF